MSTYQDTAERVVREYVSARLEKTDPDPHFSAYVVWFTFTLGNWKALVSTTLPDGMYYEVTYDQLNGRIYLDAYKKWDNVSIEVTPGGTRVE